MILWLLNNYYAFTFVNFFAVVDCRAAAGECWDPPRVVYSSPKTTRGKWRNCKL